MIEIKVPGKVMLSGEYGVLHGGKAVLMPVPVYLTLWESHSTRLKDLSPMIREALLFPIEEIKSYENKYALPGLAVDDSHFYSLAPNGSRSKLGLGLSAAEAVGTVAFRFERAGIPWQLERDKVIKYAFKINEKVQDRIGSGADIAACGIGRPIVFQRTKDSLLIEPIDLNRANFDPEIKLVWTGISADTRQLVRGFETWLENYSNSDHYLQRLITAGNMLSQSWFCGPADLLYERLDNYLELLHEIADLASIPIFLPVHEELIAWAALNGGRAKPSGAGGGDMAILVGNLPIRDPQQTVIPIGI